jgi:hypothetical protein
VLVAGDGGGEVALDVVAAEPRALGDDHALAGPGEPDLGEDLERDRLGVGRRVVGHLGGAR